MFGGALGEMGMNFLCNEEAQKNVSMCPAGYVLVQLILEDS